MLENPPPEQEPSSPPPDPPQEPEPNPELATQAEPELAPVSPPPAPVTIPPRLQWLLLALVCLSTFALRSVFAYPYIFRPNLISFSETDAYYHMRHVEHMLHNFPHRMSWDAFGTFPFGQPEFTGPLFDYILATIIWIAGLGSPSKHLMEVIGAWFPVVLATLIPLALFWLGRAIFSPAAGLIAGALTAVSSGHFLRIGSLGFVDHHVLESLLACLVLFAYARAMAESTAENASGARRWTLWFALLLGAYLLTWVAGALLVAILVGWTAISCLFRHWRRESALPLARILVPALLMAFLLHLPASHIAWARFTQAALLGGAAGILCLTLLSEYFRPAPRYSFFITLLGIGLGVFSLIWSFYPALLVRVILQVARMVPSGPWRTISELRPILQSSNAATVAAIWDQFGATLFVAALVLLWLAFSPNLKSMPGRSLFLFYSTVMILEALVQVRMTYYAVPAAALLAAYPCAWALQGSWPRRIFGILLIGGMIIPEVPTAIAIQKLPAGPSEAWWKLVHWLRDNTPPPFPNMDAYFAKYARSRREFSYPPTAYGIMTWWDNGHLINYGAHRMPSANPHQTGAITAAKFYLSQTQPEALELLRKVGARYVIGDPSLLMMRNIREHKEVFDGTLTGVAYWAAENPRRYFDAVNQEVVEGITEPIAIYYPDYYRTMAVRLTLFDGQAVVPANSTWVVRLKETNLGGFVKLDLDFSRQFETYEQAEEFRVQSNDPSLRIAGLDPFRTCIPLEKLTAFSREYQGESSAAVDNQLVPGLSVFYVSSVPVQ